MKPYTPIHRRLSESRGHVTFSQDSWQSPPSPAERLDDAENTRTAARVRARHARPLQARLPWTEVQTQAVPNANQGIPGHGPTRRPPHSPARIRQWKQALSRLSRRLSLTSFPLSERVFFAHLKSPLHLHITVSDWDVATCRRPQVTTRAERAQSSSCPLRRWSSHRHRNSPREDLPAL